MRLFCPDDSSLDPHARWQKDGRPISSARCVCSLHSPSDLLRRAGECGATAPLTGASSSLPQEPGAQAPSLHSGTSCSPMAPWSSAPCGQRTLAPTAVAAPGQTVTLRRSSFASQVSVPTPPQWVSRAPGSGIPAGRAWARGPQHWRTSVSLGQGLLVAGTTCSSWAGADVLPLVALISPLVPRGPHGPPFLPPPSPHSSPLASPCLMTGGDVAVIPEAEPRHFPQARDPAQGHSPRDPSLGGGSGGRGAVSSSHPWPTSR